MKTWALGLPSLDLPFPDLPRLPGELVFAEYVTATTFHFHFDLADFDCHPLHTVPPLRKSLSRPTSPTPTTIPYIDWTTRSFTQLAPSPQGCKRYSRHRTRSPYA